MPAWPTSQAEFWNSQFTVALNSAIPVNQAPTMTDVTRAISADNVDPIPSIKGDERRVRIMTILHKRKGPAGRLLKSGVLRCIFNHAPMHSTL